VQNDPSDNVLLWGKAQIKTFANLFVIVQHVKSLEMLNHSKADYSVKEMYFRHMNMYIFNCP